MITDKMVEDLSILDKKALSDLVVMSKDIADRQEKRISSLEGELIKLILADGDCVEVCLYCGNPRGGKLGCCGEVHYVDEYYLEGCGYIVKQLEDETLDLEEI